MNRLRDKFLPTYILELASNDPDLCSARLLQDLFETGETMNKFSESHRVPHATAFESPGSYVQLVKTLREVPKPPLSVDVEGAEYPLRIVDYEPVQDPAGDSIAVFVFYDCWEQEGIYELDVSVVDQWQDFWETQIPDHDTHMQDGGDDGLDDSELAQHFVASALESSTNQSGRNEDYAVGSDHLLGLLDLSTGYSASLKAFSTFTDDGSIEREAMTFFSKL
jgi:hypothetical protein